MLSKQQWQTIKPNMSNIHYCANSELVSYAAHLKQLSTEDRATRFGYSASNHNIDQLILDMLYHPEDHHLFVAQRNGTALGFTHLAKCDAGWELAVSVQGDQQGQGIGNNLMTYAIDWARTHGVESVFMHCIRDNTRIQHLATKHGLQVIERSGPDITAQVSLPPPTTTDYTVDFVREQQALMDQMLELQQRWLANFNPLSRRQRNDISDRSSSRPH
jgi:GNAT superfamily N-acetyltransferase